LRSPVKHVIDDFSNTTSMNHMLDNSYHTGAMMNSEQHGKSRILANKSKLFLSIQDKSSVDGNDSIVGKPPITAANHNTNGADSKGGESQTVTLDKAQLQQLLD